MHPTKNTTAATKMAQVMAIQPPNKEKYRKHCETRQQKASQECPRRRNDERQEGQLINGVKTKRTVRSPNTPWLKLWFILSAFIIHRYADYFCASEVNCKIPLPIVSGKRWAGSVVFSCSCRSTLTTNSTLIFNAICPIVY